MLLNLSTSAGKLRAWARPHVRRCVWALRDPGSVSWPAHPAGRPGAWERSEQLAQGSKHRVHAGLAQLQWNATVGPPAPQELRTRKPQAHHLNMRVRHTAKVGTAV